MVGREIRQIDLIKSIMAVFPCVPDQFSVYNRRCTVGKISGHFVCRASLLAGSVNGSIINITLTGPEKHEAVAAGFYKMRCSGAVRSACIVGKIPHNRCSSGF